jgi:hypothetical protein
VLAENPCVRADERIAEVGQRADEFEVGA